MPPRKRARHPSVAARFLASLSPLPASPGELTPADLQAAYGLGRCAVDCHPASVFPRPSPVPVEEKNGKGKEKEKELQKQKQKEEDLVQVPDSETEDAQDDYDEDEEVVVVPGKRKTPGPASKTYGKGNGKGKAKESRGALGKEKEEGCSNDLCGGNPLCLNALGQDKWEDDKKAFKAFRKAKGVKAMDPDNTRDESEKDLPVGLRNLGATCYVNSFLQVWYQDLTFRSGVYACLPPASGNVESSPLFQLQVLFAFLQTSPQRVYDPEQLVSALKLDKGEQQDAQEFSKLFLNLLDFEFRKQGLRLVQRQFEGKIEYGVRCLECRTTSSRESEFLELEISLTKNCNLEDRIAESLKDERMDGENQYRCETCGGMRDAVRETQLKSLPPVLHFSLLRFVFSPTDLTRSKSTHAIAYPLRLDMGQYLPDPAAEKGGKKTEVWYGLKGVLMHKGPSAHHGHYVAQVHDALKDKWFLFDDEAVSEIEDLNAPSQYDDPDKEKDQDKKSKKVPPGFKRGGNGEIMPKSKDAYMLVYTLLPSSSGSGSSTTATDTPATPPALVAPVPPPLALFRVEELDQVQRVAAEAFQAEEKVVHEEFEALREKKRGVYNTWHPQKDEDAFLVSKAGLKRWLDEGLVVDKEQDKDPSKPQSKLPSPRAIDGQSDTPADPTEMDVETTTVVAEPNGNGHAEDAVMLDNEEGKSSVIDSQELLCEHGNVDPAKVDRMKVVSQAGLMALRDLGVTLEPEFLTRSALCRECVWTIVADKLYADAHAEHVSTYAEANKGPSAEDDVWISATWIVDWLRSLPKMHVAGTLVDPSPSDAPHGAEVVCEHGRLQPNEKRRRAIRPQAAAVLKSLWGKWDPPERDFAKCKKCEKEQTQTDEDVQQARKIQTAERAVLRSFTDQTRLNGSLGPVILQHEAYYAIPRSFQKLWREWTKNKGAPRPEGLDNDPLLCQHGRVTIDIDDEVAHPHKIDIVSDKEWKLLQTSYNAQPMIKVLNRDGRLLTVPAACAECLSEDRENYSSTVVNLRTLAADDLNADGTRKRDVPSSPEAVLVGSWSPNVTQMNGSGTRSSARIKQQPVIKATRALRKLEVERSWTIKDVKVLISKKFRVSPIYQRLFFDGRELENDEKVAELVLSGKMLELFEVKVDDDLDLSQLDDVVVSPKDRKRKSAPEHGFSGTGLTGWEGPAPGAGSAKRACPVCTVFQEDDDAEVCYMCETPLTS